jgi:hypothetical protein
MILKSWILQAIRLKSVALDPKTTQLYTGLLSIQEDLPKKNEPSTPEFDLNVGHTIDILRNDMSNFLESELDFTIYTDCIYIRDPLGFGFNGITMYKNTFSAIRIFNRVVADDFQFTHRIRYERGQKHIVVHWQSRLTFMGDLGWLRPTHLDGISYLFLDDHGKIRGHKIDQIVFNYPLALSLYNKCTFGSLYKQHRTIA